MNGIKFHVLLNAYTNDLLVFLDFILERINLPFKMN